MLLIILGFLNFHQIVDLLSDVVLFIADDRLSNALDPLLLVLLYSLLYI